MSLILPRTALTDYRCDNKAIISAKSKEERRTDVKHDNLERFTRSGSNYYDSERVDRFEFDENKSKKNTKTSTRLSKLSSRLRPRKIRMKKAFTKLEKTQDYRINKNEEEDVSIMKDFSTDSLDFKKADNFLASPTRKYFSYISSHTSPSKDMTFNSALSSSPGSTYHSMQDDAYCVLMADSSETNTDMQKRTQDGKYSCKQYDRKDIVGFPDNDIEMYLQSTGIYHNSYSYNNGNQLEYQDQLSVSVMTEPSELTNDTGLSSGYTQSTATTSIPSPTRKRTPGAAKNRAARARQAASVHCGKIGWADTIQAAAIAHDREWSFGHGWLPQDDACNNSAADKNSRDETMKEHKIFEQGKSHEKSNIAAVDSNQSTYCNYTDDIDAIVNRSRRKEYEFRDDVEINSQSNMKAFPNDYNANRAKVLKAIEKNLGKIEKKEINFKLVAGESLVKQRIRQFEERISEHSDWITSRLNPEQFFNKNGEELSEGSKRICKYWNAATSVMSI